MSKKILCLDMDGVLALWDDYYTSYEEMTKPGFYEFLQPSENVLRTIRLFMKKYSSNVEVHILSAAFGEAAIVEKNRWLDKYLPEISKEVRHFVQVGEDKSKVFPDISNVSLLDDYTKNLRNWKDAGGRGIKLLNGENNVSGKWLGDYVYYRTEPEILADTLYALVMK